MARGSQEEHAQERSPDRRVADEGNDGDHRGLLHEDRHLEPVRVGIVGGVQQHPVPARGTAVMVEMETTTRQIYWRQPSARRP
jgi:hypothetical protein